MLFHLIVGPFIKVLLMEAGALNSVISRLLEAREKPGKIVQLSETEIKQLCFVSRDIFLRQPNLLELEAPVKICGTLLSLFLSVSSLRLCSYGTFCL